MSVPIKSAGNKIRGELQTLKTGLDAGGHRFDREGFRQARHAFEKNVAIGEQAEQQPIDQIFLPDDDMSNLFAQRRNPAAELLDLLRNFLRRFHRFCETRNVTLRSNKAIRLARSLSEQALERIDANLRPCFQCVAARFQFSS